MSVGVFPHNATEKFKQTIYIINGLIISRHYFSPLKELLKQKITVPFPVSHLNCSA